MRSILLSMPALALLASAIQAQTYHPAVYLFGGRGTVLTTMSHPAGI